jgi:hypothetical protein
VESTDGQAEALQVLHQNRGCFDLSWPAAFAELISEEASRERALLQPGTKNLKSLTEIKGCLSEGGPSGRHSCSLI